MAVEVRVNGSAFDVGVPRRLFQTPADSGWDVTADGQRLILSVLPAQQQSSQTPITVVLNWQQQLK
jgi:hypothetical protein